MRYRELNIDLFIDSEKYGCLMARPEELQAFHEALGRRIGYAIFYGGSDSPINEMEVSCSVWFAGEGPNEQIEILCAYRKPESKREFVVASVSRDQRTWYSNHS